MRRTSLPLLPQLIVLRCRNFQRLMSPGEQSRHVMEDALDREVPSQQQTSLRSFSCRRLKSLSDVMNSASMCCLKTKKKQKQTNAHVQSKKTAAKSSRSLHDFVERFVVFCLCFI